MNNKFLYLLFLISLACSSPQQEEKTVVTSEEENFQWRTEQFADLKILRYQIPGWEKLTLQQKKLVYYLTQAGLEGRDIIYDQNYQHNLAIRDVLENIYSNYEGDRSSDEWKAFEVYLKRIWFSNGIHHHYSMNKIMPGFDEAYLQSLVEATGVSIDEKLLPVMFDPSVDGKKVNLDPEKGLLKGSAVNFYGDDVTVKDVESYYSSIIDKDDETPISYGLNSKLVKNENGQLEELVWKSGGMYGPAIDKIIGWLEKAVTVAENEAQEEALELLIEYYRNGDLEKWDEYNIAWTKATEGDIDYINGFVEVYNDPMAYRGSYEMIVQIKDFDASERMKVLMENAQWFEDHSSIMDQHKRENVVGITYKVVNVAGEAGDASPATPIGVNLPNANWIRANHGSKSVSLGNIISAYENASGDSYLKEFSYNDEEIERSIMFSAIADKLHTALHEVIGHASGKLEPGVGTPKETLKNYSSTLEEGRADLVALYFLYDPKVVELGLLPSLEAGKAAYDDYIKNGLMLQLRRIEPGENIEEAHMRNRQFIAKWVYEKGQGENVIERKEKDGKTYFVINDYKKLRELFGELLKKVQQIKSQGDFEAAKALIEDYGVKVDAQLHKEVLERTETLDIAPYSGFINPELEAVEENGEIIDVEVKYPNDFSEQMQGYSQKYGNLVKESVM